MTKRSHISNGAPSRALTLTTGPHGLPLIRQWVSVSRLSLLPSERAALPDAEFARERLGIWAPTGGNAVIDVAAWHACADEDSTRWILSSLLLMSGPTPRASAISVCGMNAAGLHHVETVATGSGMSWVEPRLVELAEKWSPAGVVIDAKARARH